MLDFWTCSTVEPGVMPPSAALLGAPLPGLAVDVVAGFEPLDDPDDPPQAVSSKASEPRPAAAANPLLRITTLHSRFSVPWGRTGVDRILRMQPRSQYAGNVPDCRVGPRLLSRYLVIWSHLAAEPCERHRVTIVDAHVPGFEKLEM